MTHTVTHTRTAVTHTVTHTHTTVAPHLDAINQAVSSGGDKLTERESAYITAVKAYASGSLFNFAEELVNMLYDYPLGMLVAKTVDLPVKILMLGDTCMKINTHMQMSLLFVCHVMRTILLESLYVRET